MRIATSTILYGYYNYGAFLQAYALQQVIHSLGYDSEVIKYQTSEPLQRRLLKKRSVYKYIKATFIIAEKFIEFILYKVYMKEYIEAFQAGFGTFRRKFIKCNEVVYSERNAEKIGKVYDKIIVGSDQVWHDSKIKFKCYTLDFTNSRPIKLSYAASFGNDDISAEHAPYVKKLADFDRITVRETSGVDIIKKYTGRDAEMVLDPTFLLNKTQWTSLAEQSDYPLPRRYVFVYAINDKKREILAFAKRLAKKIDGKVILIHRGIFKDWLLYSHVQSGVNPADWVKLLLHADYVVTDSFHGTAFSINLEKQFYVYANSQTGRIDTILNMVGLQRRRIDGGRIDKRKIDFAEPRRKLNAERERCNGILKEMLEWDASDE